MDHKILRPERFSVLPNTSGADKAWLHWKRTFTNYIASAIRTPAATQPGDGETADPTATLAANKLDVLINYVSSSVYDYISECADYDTAIQTLESMYVVPKNEIFARHLLATRKQQPGESLDTFLNVLKLLAKDCQFKAVSAEVYKQEQIRDAFINGLQTPSIRQRLLENVTLSLTETFTQARSLELAQKTSDQYNTPPPLSLNTVNADEATERLAATGVGGKRTCFFCGGPRHNRSECQALESVCYNCDKVGHYSKVCKSRKKKSEVASAATITLASASTAGGRPKTIVEASIAGHKTEALIGTGSLGSSFISKKVSHKIETGYKSC